LSKGLLAAVGSTASSPSPKSLRVRPELCILFCMRINKVGKAQFWTSTVILLVSAVFASAETHQRTLLPGQSPPVVPSLQPVGRLDGSKVLNLSIGLPLRNQEALTNFLRQLYDPASPSYRHYLAPEEFTAQFGPTEGDYEAVVAWATQSGFTVTGRHESRMLLEVSAPVTDIERALQVTMRTYAHPTEARTFFAPDTEPSVDGNIPILNISGLDNFARPHPKIPKIIRHASLKRTSKVTPKVIGSGPNGLLAGFDYRAAYAPGVPQTGTGQSVGVLEFDGYFATDITTYESQTGISNVPLQNVHLDGYNGTPIPLSSEYGYENEEVALDIEMAISMAPGLSSVVVFEDNPDNSNPLNVLESMSSSTYSNIKQFSCSWDFGSISPSARTNMDGYFMKFASQGQSFFDAVGDLGAYTNGLPIPAPDDDEYITLVGGTALGTAGPTDPWLTEIVWNEQGGPGYAGSAGGVSTFYGIPYWQKGVNMNINNGSKTHRNCPDVAMMADNIFLVADDGELENIAGTSAASPMWAGFTALANQAAVAAGRTNVGFLNPAIYDIGTNSGYTACFDDVTIGNNTNNNPTEWFAVLGYDLCTGWGSPTGGSLIIALTQPDGFQITPGRGAVANGPVGGPFSVAMQNISLANTGTNALNWSFGAASDWLNVSSTSGALSSGEAASVTLSLNSAANALAAGVYTANLWFTNTTSGLAQLRQFTLQVDQNLVLDGGFEAGDFCYWNLLGDSTIFTNNYVDDGEYTGYSPYDGNYFAALGNFTSLAYLAQPLPTKPGQLYLISFWLQNQSYGYANQFQVLWNSNSTTANIIFNQVDMGDFGWSNMTFMVQAASDITTLEFGATNYAFFALDDVSVTPLPVPMPNFTTPIVVDGSLQLSWPTTPGVAYQLQYTADLTQTNWTAVVSTNATASTTTVSEPTDSASQRFYRVVISP
jgi:Pro-kumamolisin, activation domain/Viral BACON domain